MRVVQAIEFGAPEVLVPGTLADPVPGAGEVVVDVAVADVLFLDTLVRRGLPGPWSVRPPYVPGAGVVGRVSAVGAGVADSWIGQRVAGKPGHDITESGTTTVAETAAAAPPTGGYAQRAIVPARSLLAIPDELTEHSAAALLNDGATARQLAEAAAVRAGEWVLITPAAAGLGGLLVQLVRAAGGRVVAGVGGPAVVRSKPNASASGERKLALAREHGAEVVVDYGATDWTDQVSKATGGAGVDVVLDGVGGEVGRSAFGTIANGGRFFAFGAPGGGFTTIEAAEARERNVRAVGLMELALTPADLIRYASEALAEAAAGRLSPVIGQTFDLNDAAHAHAAIEGRAVVGKTLLLV